MKNKAYPYHQRTFLKDLKELVSYSGAKFAEDTAFKFERGGIKVEITYKRFKADVDALGTYFYSLGLRNAKIALVGENSYEWVLTYFAAVNGSNIIVPIDKELADGEICNLLKASGCDMAVYSPAKENAIRLSREQGLPISHYLCTDNLEDAIGAGRKLIQSGDADFMEHVVDEEQPCAIIYTSGTTGTPKGVMLSHKNLASDAYHSLEAMTIARDTVAVLPFNHTFGFLACVVCQLWVGYSIFINSSLKTVLKDIQTAKPGHISVVPLFVENFYKNIWKAAERQGKKKALEQLIKVSNTMRKAGVDLRRKLFKSVWDNLGGRLELIISGGAPIDHKYIKGFDDLGITVINGYGITECSPIVSINRNKWIKYGSVGQPIPTVSVKIHEPNEAGEGEILVKGDIVMQGYYNDPEATAAAITDGWFNTGDIGTIDADGFLYITGRKKNLIILENGKNVYPEELEALIGQIEYVTEVLVYEDGGLITAEIYTEEQENKDAAKDAIKRDIQQLNKTLAQYKQIRKIKFRAVEFEKTTTKKIKRF